MPGRVYAVLRQQVGQILSEVLFGAGRTDAVVDLSRRHVEVRDQREGAMTDVLELLALGSPRTHRLRRSGPLQGLHAGHFVEAARLDALVGPFRGQPIGLADITAAHLEVLAARTVQPATQTMWLEVQFAQEATN